MMIVAIGIDILVMAAVAIRMIDDATMVTRIGVA
jgi:hypothetical protein